MLGPKLCAMVGGAVALVKLSYCNVIMCGTTAPIMTICEGAK